MRSISRRSGELGEVQSINIYEKLGQGGCHGINMARHFAGDAEADWVVGWTDGDPHGETEEEFANTIALLERTQFDVIHVAAYSPRPGTYAHRKLADDVSREVKKERLKMVEQVHAASASVRNRRLLGETVEVLVEREDEGRSTGRTPLGQLVHFTGAGLVGELVNVTIAEATSWSLRGQREGEQRSGELLLTVV